MRFWLAGSSAGLALLSLVAGACAQQQRFELRCLVEGNPAKVINDNSLDTPARAQYLNDQRTISVSLKLTEGLPAVVQTFLVAHECGHLLASPTLSAPWSGATIYLGRQIQSQA